jgi:RimJ/RimL family protein N-acetyltransferase
VGTYVRLVPLRFDNTFVAESLPARDPSDEIDEITIREIRADDHDRLRDHHERLSPESRYRRFLAAKPRLTSADARYLVEIDGCDHFALVATVPDGEATTEGPGERIVAVARFIRLPDNREVAELAIVVNDDFQGQGMGAELINRLAAAAVQRGVRRFRATMLSDNLAIHRLLDGLAAGPVQRRRLGGLSEMEFELPGAENAGADCGCGRELVPA